MLSEIKGSTSCLFIVIEQEKERKRKRESKKKIGCYSSGMAPEERSERKNGRRLDVPRIQEIHPLFSSYLRELTSRGPSTLPVSEVVVSDLFSTNFYISFPLFSSSLAPGGPSSNGVAILIQFKRNRCFQFLLFFGGFAPNSNHRTVPSNFRLRP